MPDVNRAAEIIYQYLRNGDVVDYVKSDLWPDTVDEGYEIQAALAPRIAQPVPGWKIAATAEAGRSHINVDRPLAGRLFASMCHTDGAVVSIKRNRMLVAEVEFAFTLGCDIPPREADYTEQEIADCIKSLHAGLEFPDSRFKDFTQPGTAALIADIACARDFVLGEASTETFNAKELSSQATSLMINDEIVTTGLGSDALGGPLEALVWLANTLSKLGITLEKDQFVTTGVTGKPSAIKPGDVVQASLGKFGSVSATVD